jgi:predicted nucleic acid-binding protein
MTAATSAGRPYLLDTSVILHLVRGKALGQQIQATYDLIHCQPRPLVSVVSLAEAGGCPRSRSAGSDRLIVASALAHGLVLATHDQAIRTSAVITIWQGSV